MLNIIKIVLEDLKTDLIAIKNILTGKNKHRWTELREGFTTVDWNTAIKDNIMWFTIILLALICGSMISAAYYNARVTEYVYNAISIAEDKGINILRFDTSKYIDTRYILSKVKSELR